LKPWVNRFGAFFLMKRADAAFAPFADNTAWIMGSKGQESHQEFKTLTGKYIEPFRRVYERYADRQKKWDSMGKTTGMKAIKSSVEEVYCPKCKTNWLTPAGDKPED